jgi:hypothetical protein
MQHTQVDEEMHTKFWSENLNGGTIQKNKAYTWEENIRKDFKEIGCEGVD